MDTSKNKVLAEDKLFATLDPTTRRLLLPQLDGRTKELLITDTVGFIRDLPNPLREAFRATLEETLEADVLLLVVDLSDPDWHFQLKTTQWLLDSLSTSSVRQVLANKIDHCESGAIDAIQKIDQNVMYISSTSGSGLKGLKNWLQKQFWENSPKSALRVSSKENL